MKQIAGFINKIKVVLYLSALIILIIFIFQGLSSLTGVRQTIQSPSRITTAVPYPLSETIPPSSFNQSLPYPPPGQETTLTPINEEFNLCKFESISQTITNSTSSESLLFSDIKVVLTSTTSIEIAGWLSDNQNLLITRLVQDQPNRYNEVFNVDTGETTNSVKGHNFQDSPPVWFDPWKSILYLDFNQEDQIVLRASPERGKQPLDSITGLTPSAFTINPITNQLVFFSQTNWGYPQTYDLIKNKISPLDVHLPSTSTIPSYWEYYRSRWSPEGDKIIFYNDKGCFLVNVVNGTTCKLDFGSQDGYHKWALNIRWSPNGRYISALTTIKEPVLPFVDLTIIDNKTGNQFNIKPEHITKPWTNYVADFYWANDSINIILLSEIRADNYGIGYYGLYSTGVISGELKRLFPETEFGGGWGNSLAWSNDNSKIAITCPILLQTDPIQGLGRLCIINVSSQ